MTILQGFTCFLERCTNVVASPDCVEGALSRKRISTFYVGKEATYVCLYFSRSLKILSNEHDLLSRFIRQSISNTI